MNASGTRGLRNKSSDDGSGTAIGTVTASRLRSTGEKGSKVGRPVNPKGSLPKEPVNVAVANPVGNSPSREPVSSAKRNSSIVSLKAASVAAPPSRDIGSVIASEADEKVMVTGSKSPTMVTVAPNAPATETGLADVSAENDVSVPVDGGKVGGTKMVVNDEPPIVGPPGTGVASDSMGVAAASLREAIVNTRIKVTPTITALALLAVCVIVPFTSCGRQLIAKYARSH